MFEFFLEFFFFFFGVDKVFFLFLLSLSNTLIDKRLGSFFYDSTLLSVFFLRLTRQLFAASRVSLRSVCRTSIASNNDLTIHKIVDDKREKQQNSKHSKRKNYQQPFNFFFT